MVELGWKEGDQIQLISEPCAIKSRVSLLNNTLGHYCWWLDKWHWALTISLMSWVFSAMRPGGLSFQELCTVRSSPSVTISSGRTGICWPSNSLAPMTPIPRDAMAIYGAKLDAGRSAVTWDWEGPRKRAEVVLSKQEHLAAYSMRIVKARIGQKRKAGTAFTLDSDHSMWCRVSTTSADRVRHTYAF